jgi:hypothetical protein
MITLAGGVTIRPRIPVPVFLSGLSRGPHAVARRWGAQVTTSSWKVLEEVE